MKTKLEPIPHFASEDEEDEFWQTHDSTDYVDWSKAQRVRLLNLKSSTGAHAGSGDKRIIPSR
jgi:CopG antitoxin of type II toxin-antitoxin system